MRRCRALWVGASMLYWENLGTGKLLPFPFLGSGAHVCFAKTRHPACRCQLQAAVTVHRLNQPLSGLAIRVRGYISSCSPCGDRLVDCLTFLHSLRPTCLAALPHSFFWLRRLSVPSQSSTL